MFTFGRRRMLALLATAALAEPLLAARPPTAAAASGAIAPLVMQVVAHEDDDILFMNPDLAASLAAGVPTVTVFLTAGNQTGDPCPANCGGQPDTDWERTENRQLGAINAYSRMAGVSDTVPGTDEESRWARGMLSVGDREVERYVLRERPNVHLIFVNLHDGNLISLEQDRAATDFTVTPPPVDNHPPVQPTTYTGDDVARLLQGLMMAYEPSVLRGQDEYPDPAKRWHPDHLAAARFAAEAALLYRAAQPSTANNMVQVNYRDYNIETSPVNLEGSAVSAKRAAFEEYQSHDHSTGNYSPDWFSRMYYRWSRGTSWAGVNADGRPQAFVVRNGMLYTCWRTTSGGWADSLQLADPGGRLAPGLAVGTNADGRLEVFAHRLSDHHIVSLAQNTASQEWRQRWTDHGTPNPGDLASQVGSPVVANDDDGRLELFVRNAGGGLSSKWQTSPSGDWSSAWADMGGSDIQDPVSAVRNGDRRIEVFASTSTKMLSWWQTSRNGSFAGPGDIPGARPASPPKAVLNGAGRIHLAYRESGTGAMGISRQEVSGGSWTTPSFYQGHGGVGEPAATVAGGMVTLFERNRGTGVSCTVQATEGVYAAWRDLGGTVLDYPAAVTDGAGVAHVFVIGTNGRIYVHPMNTADGIWHGPF
ncbi:PIG-L family deacetylase [Kitasatospora sp. NPDC005748]|uniref:PIG-L family deacetylase n=1 Tax=Kitasatospora sp. NPDC005748 TaxID=3157063 RepID=UPI0033F8873F